MAANIHVKIYIYQYKNLIYTGQTNNYSLEYEAERVEV